MAQFIKIYPDKPNEVAIAKVVKVLKEGGLVIYPTDTVYGLGCDITNTKANSNKTAGTILDFLLICLLIITFI